METKLYPTAFKIIRAAYCYYKTDIHIMSDSEYDRHCRWLQTNWNIFKETDLGKLCVNCDMDFSTSTSMFDFNWKMYKELNTISYNHMLSTLKDGVT